YARDAVTGLARRIAQERDFQVEQFEWPAGLVDIHDVHATIYSKSLSYYFQGEAKMGSKMSPIMTAMIAEGEGISPASFAAALRRQEQICEAIDRLLEPYDIVLSLGTSSSAPLRGQEELRDPSLIWTASHVPAVAAPAFRCPAG